MHDRNNSCLLNPHEDEVVLLQRSRPCMVLIWEYQDQDASRPVETFRVAFESVDTTMRDSECNQSCNTLQPLHSCST